MTTSFEVELTRIRELSDSTRDFRFVRIDGQDNKFEAGQFYRFIFSDADGEFERSYSLVNFEADAHGPVMDLVISRVEGGRATRLLFDTEPGIKAQVSGPFGRLVLPEKQPERLIMISASVGIAPYMPMLAPLNDWLGQTDITVEFLFGVRDRSEFLYQDVLLAMQHKHSRFHLHLCLSREQQAEADHEHLGYVQAQLEQLQPNPATDYVLLCGNPNMIDDCYALLKDRGFKARQVRREKYVFARESVPKKQAALTDEQKRLIAEKMKRYQKLDST